MSESSSRRTFLKQSSAVAGGGIAASLANTAYAAGSGQIKIALVGAGGRGSGAVAQILNTKGNCKLVSVADAFRSNAEKKTKWLSRKYKSKVDVPKDRIFVGLDAYKKAIDVDGVNLVVIGTPPGFKPQQFEYAISKGKNVFSEKPVAVDAPGVRRFLAAVESSKKQNLLVGIGLQRRHEHRYIETVKRLQDGAIGDINLMRVYWNGRGIWYRGRRPGMTDMQFQTNNWFHFIWACGDQICEQHIHNIDVGCWVKNAYPVKCNGMGGSEMRMNGDHKQSQIFDHTFCEFTFPDGTKMYSQGRHVRGAWTSVAEYAHGTKGIASPSGWIRNFDGKKWRRRGGKGGHQQEQTDLVAALSSGKIYNEGEFGAKSTFAAILGREACYSGKVIKWDDLLKKGRDLCPGIDNWNWDTTPPCVKDKHGKYPVPRPGRYNPYA